MEAGTTLERFVSSPLYKEVDNGQTRRLSGMSPAIGKCTSMMLEVAKSNLRRYFKVVGLTERFDETLVLLKCVLRWQNDLMYYPINVNPADCSTSLSISDLDTIKSNNEMDLGLYEYARELMDEAISAQGSNFSDELRRLELRKQSLYENVSPLES